ncbi:hypothetical protein RugamoR64_12830 [Duganella rhizosphaerae]|uniref:hypothetical protein n=1 Tax=Duganella rhizosphaerae TaxID=2885763 RepID=UPI0030E7D0D1
MDTNTIVSTVAGGVISALVSWIFYWLGGRGLAKEAKRLHDLNVLLLRSFEEAGLARLNRDASGQPIGLVFEGAAVMKSTSAIDSCDVEVIRATKIPRPGHVGPLMIVSPEPASNKILDLVNLRIRTETLLFGSAEGRTAK